jgi:uncharacterized protein (DUF1810 family)
MANDPTLDRFITAQAPVIENVRAELTAGQKTSHWMWFIFPQIAGLGTSAMSQLYAIANLDEARTYLAHPILGPRLRDCTQLTLAARRPALSIFGLVDSQKLHSSLTLFALASEEPLFAQALMQLFGGEPDQGTLDKLGPA